MSISSLSSSLSAYRKTLQTYTSTLSTLNSRNAAWAQIDTVLEQLQAKIDVLKDNSFFSSKSMLNTNNAVANFVAANAPQATYTVNVYQLATQNIIESSLPINFLDGSHSFLQSTEEINTGISGSEPVSLNPDKKIASGAAAMRLDPGKIIMSGSFKINGQTIAVTSADTINSILAKINESDANVTAEYNSEADIITIQSKSYDPEAEITLTDDTSGFISAMKLDGALIEQGTASDTQSALGLTSFADQITGNSFSINNVSFSIDTSQDSIFDVIDRINNSAAGVLIEYDSENKLFTMTSKNIGEDITLADNSGFLATIGLMNNAGDTDDSDTTSVYEATKAQFELNGQYFEQSSNSITVNGGRIDLLAQGTATITITDDRQRVKDAVKSFVAYYNLAINTINKHLKGALKNDSTLASLSANLTNSIRKNFSNSGVLQNMSQLGVTLERVRGRYTGRAVFNESCFNSRFGALKESMAKYFADDADGDGQTDDLGFANLIGNYLNTFTNNDTGAVAKKINLNDLGKYQTQLNISNVSDKITLISNEIAFIKNAGWIPVNAYLKEVQTALDALKEKAAFLSNTASSSNSAVATASASVNSIQTTYQVFVDNTATLASAVSSDKLGLSSGVYTVAGYEEIASNATADPNGSFRYGAHLDAGDRVIAGSFTINGENISVTGNDTINSVLNRINKSGAGVVAMYDSDADKVFLSAGQGGQIQFGPDTSGFLDAMKLVSVSGNQVKSYVTVEGSMLNKYKPLSETSLTQGDNAVSNGSFTINNVTFSVNTSTDTLYSILKSINDSEAGVVVDYDEVTDRVFITSKEFGKEIKLENDTSNFLQRLNLLDGDGDQDQTAGLSVYRGEQARVQINGQEVVSDTNTIVHEGTTFAIKSEGNAAITVSPDTATAVNAVKNFVDKFNYEMAIIDYHLNTDLKGNTDLYKLKANLYTRAISTIENSGSLTKLQDIGIGIEKIKGRITGKLTLSTPALENALANNRSDVWKLFADDTDNDGQADDGGFAVNTDANLELYTAQEGMIPSKIQAGNTLYNATRMAIYWKERSLTKTRDELQDQYSALQQMPNLTDPQRQLMDNLAFQIKSLSNYKFNVLS